MITHEITFIPDFATEEVKKKLNFNLRLSALQEMVADGWDKQLSWISGNLDMSDLDHRKRVLEIWNDLIHRSYGVRDGDRFVQSKDISDKFMGSAEYDALIIDLLYTQGSQLAGNFIRGLFPAKLIEEIKQRGGAEQVSEIEKKLGELG